MSRWVQHSTVQVSLVEPCFLTELIESPRATGGPYEIFAGRDASRGMAKQSFDPEMLTPLSDKIDPLDDLTKAEWDNLKDWEGQFSSAYFTQSGLD